jgi:hypothetical protein
MINLTETIRQMTANAAAIRSLLGTISEEQTEWKPDPETWSLSEVMAHLYNEERGDFKAHIKEILNQPTKAWGELQPGWAPVDNLHQALELFLSERAASISWLKALSSPNWDASIQAVFGPASEVITISAGDVLVSWVAHDHLHLRQVNELLFAWNAKQGLPFSVDYAGGW